jgi:hypothetical protein
VNQVTAADAAAQLLSSVFDGWLADGSAQPISLDPFSRTPCSSLMILIGVGALLAGSGASLS